jgi:hypothetical protein
LNISIAELKTLKFVGALAVGGLEEVACSGTFDNGLGSRKIWPSARKIEIMNMPAVTLKVISEKFLDDELARLRFLRTASAVRVGKYCLHILFSPKMTWEVSKKRERMFHGESRGFRRPLLLNSRR